MDKKERQYYLFAAEIVSDFAGTIALPVVILVILARVIDQKYQVGAWIYIIAFAVAALISGVIIFKKAKKYGQRYQALTDSDTSKTTNEPKDT